jgi:hypothetical protein
MRLSDVKVLVQDGAARKKRDGFIYTENFRDVIKYRNHKHELKETKAKKNTNIVQF